MSNANWLTNISQAATILMLVLAIITIIYTKREWDKGRKDRFISKIDKHIEYAKYQIKYANRRNYIKKELKTEYISKTEKLIDKLIKYRYETSVEQEFNYNEANEKLNDIILESKK